MAVVFSDFLSLLGGNFGSGKVARGKHARRLQRKTWRRSCRLQRSAARRLAIMASRSGG